MSENKPDGTPKETPRRRVAPKTLRTLVQLCIIAFVCVGLAFHTGTGTLSSWGIGAISAICPLGAVEAAIASKTIVPVGVVGLALVVVATLIVGRAFCSWGCPVPLLQRIFGTSGSRGKRRAKGVQAKDAAEVGDKACENPETDPARGGLDDSRNWVLGGVLVSTAAFGFPVFCLVCPVGLTFASVIVVWRAVQFGETTLSLLVFPAILVLEVVVLRRWCHTLCPIGALLSLIARGNKTLKATMDPNKCLVTSQGVACNACVRACPEGIDLHDGAPSTPKNECLKCGECGHVCPAHAITFPFLAKGTVKLETTKTMDGIDGKENS